MNLLVPGALALAALAGPLLVLYMLRSKRRRVEVPSIMLWGRLGAPVSSAVPWQPLRWTILLLLQLLILGLFVLSLARPFTTERALLGPHTVLVIDASGSMATDGRLDSAIIRARELAEDVSQANQMSIVLAGPQPEVLAAFARTTEVVESALDAVSVTGGPARLDEAIGLARGLATPDRPTSLLILSDGGFESLETEPVLDATHLRFDAVSPDISIDAFAPDDTGEGVVRAFVTVTNHSPGPLTADLVVAVDDLPSGSVSVDLAAGASESDLIPLDAVAGDVVSVSLDHGEGTDANPLNDRAWFVLGGGPDRGVSIVGNGSPFLSALVDVAPGFTAASGSSDVLVVDGGPLPEIDRPTWIIRPETPPEGIRVAEIARNVAVTSQRPGEPILDGVDLSTLAVAEAQVIETNTWTPIVSAGDVPLILLGEVDGRRAVYTTFDLTHSNLPVDVAFPVMGSRILQWLAGADAGAVSSGVAGDPITVAPPPGSAAQVTMPDGSIRELSDLAGIFRDTGTPGVYDVAYVSENGNVEPGVTAVRLFDPREAGSVPRDIAVSRSSDETTDDTSLVREVAPWVVGLALLLMAVEWWVGHQRPRLWGRRRMVQT